MSHEDRRINHEILSSEIVLIDETGKNVGVYATDVALQVAEEAGFDLIEVDQHHDPPVARFGDASKERFLEQRRQRAQLKALRSRKIKQIRLGAKIEEHDLETKMRHVRDFLEHGSTVKIIIHLRGRERSHQIVAYDLATKVMAALSTDGVIISNPVSAGPDVMLTVAPRR